MANEPENITVEVDDVAWPVPAEAIEALDQGLDSLAAEYEGAVARTMFDTPSANDGTITIVIPKEHLESIASQALVRIDSHGDGRRYLGAIVAGPFAEPDGLRADAPVLVSSAAHNAIFMPNYHGRAQVSLLGEHTGRGVIPPRRRPQPNSPVRLLDADEAADLLRSHGDVRLGVVEGLEEVEVRFPLTKQVLPRHFGVLGTTGGGKSTTVAGLVNQLQRAGAACVILDTEGEYTAISDATEDEQMQMALAERSLVANGVDDTHLYHLFGKDTANPEHPSQTAFRLDFSQLSPYAFQEIMDLTPAQEDRFFKAFDACSLVLRDVGIYPEPRNDAEEREALEIDDQETGYPRMTLSHLIDVAGAFRAQVANEAPSFYNGEFERNFDRVMQRIRAVRTDSEISWRALLSKLWRIHRLRVFDNPAARSLDYAQMIHPGRVNIVDLSDSESPQVNNLTIAQLLRGLQRAQEAAYDHAVGAGRPPTPLVLVIEEAHEFLSAERIKQMPVLFAQVARVARRGRKRWFGLVFVTQLPQHLPDEVLGLINNWVLHKIADSNVISRLRRSIGGVDDALWARLPNLAPGQAVVSITSHARPLLTSIDPTPARLLMVE